MNNELMDQIYKIIFQNDNLVEVVQEIAKSNLQSDQKQELRMTVILTAICENPAAKKLYSDYLWETIGLPMWKEAHPKKLK